MIAGLNKEQLLLILKFCRACSRCTTPKDIKYHYNIEKETLFDFNDLLKDLIKKIENDEKFKNIDNDYFYSKIIRELKEKFDE